MLNRRDAPDGYQINHSITFGAKNKPQNLKAKNRPVYASINIIDKNLSKLGNRMDLMEEKTRVVYQKEGDTSHHSQL